MNRRSLFGYVTGAFAFLLGSRKVKAEKLPEYIYDWQESYTNDPMCRPLGFMDDSPLIFCNDKLVRDRNVSYCKSGERGYYILIELEEGREVSTKHHGRIIVRTHYRHSPQYGRVITCKRSQLEWEWPKE